FSQEFRLGSSFDGPFNFSLGANYLRHDAEAKYYVFINTLSMVAGSANDTIPYEPGITDNAACLHQGSGIARPRSPGLAGDTAPYADPLIRHRIPLANCVYIDPNPLESLNDQGRNYFLSRNPYKLISYAAFGEAYYNITPDLKLTAGLRYTVDRKTAPQIPSWLLASHTAGEYPVAQTLFMEWREPTGRLALDWKPDLGFTDETLLYASYAHGYKAGGANPPPPVLVTYGESSSGNSQREVLPDTFEPEFVDAFELGTKNTLLDGAVTLNLAGFYYDYRGYQVSEIRNRSAVNSNYDAEVWGLEIEADWRPVENLKLGFKGGYQNTRIADGETSIDLMDRTASNPDWLVIRPFPTIPSNCILPIYVIAAGNNLNLGSGGTQYSACVNAYIDGWDPVTRRPYEPNPTLQDVYQGGSVTTRPLPANFAGYPGFDPTMPEINGGRGFAKDLSGNELPNAPNYTATITADYTVPLAGEWLVNLHTDLHWQSESWWRVFNDHEYNRLDDYFTMNLAAIFTNEAPGWKVMAYIKNVTDETALTGAFLNSDDTGLTTNVFMTEPRLYGVRVTKDFTGGGWLGDIGRCDTVCPLTVELGGGVGWSSAETSDYFPEWLDLYSEEFPLSQSFQDNDLDVGDMRSLRLIYAPTADWRVSAGYRFGKTKGFARASGYEAVEGGLSAGLKYPAVPAFYIASEDNHWRAAARDSEEFEIVDFNIGREVGFGRLGDSGRSAFGLGLRRADLRSTSRVAMDGIPARVVPPISFPLNPTRPQVSAETYTTTLESARTFEGLGPTITWDGAVRLWDGGEGGHADVEWGVAAGALFGKQTLTSEEDRFAEYSRGGVAGGGKPLFETLLDDVVVRERSDDVTVPNVGLSLGLSYSVDRIKVSTGYAYDHFFDAIDGGYEDAEQYDRTVHGPYFKLSVGFGGG
ncbi:MAG TPA: TonB-dependent receptor, partial [Caulobacteraceae bacterium]|nr:TonB-dependent receptor [Caulobacteraceae bacterium]